MCLDCGCLKPADQHDDPRHITYSRLASAAQSNDMTPMETANQIVSTLKTMGGTTFTKTATRPTVGFDIDNTCAEAAQGMLTVLNVMGDAQHKMSDCTSPDEYCLFPDHDPLLKRIHDAPGFYLNLGVYEAARLLTWALARAGFHIVLASKRDKNILPISKKWLQENNFPQFDDIIHGNDSKYKVVQKYGSNLVFIDDDPRNRSAFAGKSGCKYMMPKRPWNAKLQGQVGYNVFDDYKLIYDMLGLDSSSNITQVTL